MRPNKLYMVIPCYNEEEVLPETARRLREKLTALMEAGTISPESRVLFVNDGSKDHTWEIIARLHQENPLFSGVCLSRNRGHQNALLAGLMTARERCDITISMDADLQDDIEAIDGFLKKYQEGCEVVYGVRSSRATDTVFKRSTAQGFYKLMRLMGTPVIDNHADFRLMSRPALDALSQFGEVNLFLRGIVPMVGFKSGIVEYERHERFAGQSKYPLGKMLSFAFDGITSFSTMPIRLITLAGFGIFVVPAGSADLPGTEAAGLYCPGLGYPDGVHLAHRRPAAAGTGHSGRVHRQNLHGSQAPAPVCNRTGAGRFSGG